MLLAASAQREAAAAAGPSPPPRSPQGAGSKLLSPGGLHARKKARGGSGLPGTKCCFSFVCSVYDELCGGFVRFLFGLVFFGCFFFFFPFLFVETSIDAALTID